MPETQLSYSESDIENLVQQDLAKRRMRASAVRFILDTVQGKVRPVVTVVATVKQDVGGISG